MKIESGLCGGEVLHHEFSKLYHDSMKESLYQIIHEIGSNFSMETLVSEPDPRTRRRVWFRDYRNLECKCVTMMTL